MAMPPSAPKPRRAASPYDPTGIDDGTGGIPVATGRPALRAGAWIVLAIALAVIAGLAWRTMERKAIDRAYEQGVRALADGRRDDARMAFDRVIAERPESGAAWRQRGYAADAPDRAIEDFTRAIALDANDAEAYAARGRAWLGARQPARALPDFEAALARAAAAGAEQATVTTWRADRGAARLEAGDPKGALADLEFAATERKAIDDWRLLAVARGAAGDWAGARVAQDRAIEGGAPNAALGERALILMRLGDDAAAGVDLVRCAQVDPACAASYGARATELARELGRPPPSGAR